MRTVYSFVQEEATDRIYLVSMPKNKPSKMMGVKYRAVCHVVQHMGRRTFVSATDRDCDLPFEHIYDDDAVRYLATGMLPKYLKDKKERFE